jgi:hypothetical protein
MQDLQSSTSHRAAGYYKRVAPESRLFAQMSSCVAVSKTASAGFGTPENAVIE